MSIKTKRKRNLPAAFALALVGGFAVIESLSLPIGTLRAMGAGFMPLALGVAMLALAVLVALEQESLETVGDMATPRPILAIFGSVLAFAAMIEPLGLILATFALVVIAGLAEKRPRPFLLLAVAASLSLFGYLVFIAGLHVPFKVFPGLD